MRITLEADYAVRIIDCLARDGKRLDAATIAGRTKVTQRFCLKILRKLVAAGIVRSFKGVQGGYELNRAPEEISLCDAIEAVDGPVLLNRCLSEEIGCTRLGDPGLCFYHRAFDDVSKMVREKLGSIKFDRNRT